MMEDIKGFSLQRTCAACIHIIDPGEIRDEKTFQMFCRVWSVRRGRVSDISEGILIRF